MRFKFLICKVTGHRQIQLRMTEDVSTLNRHVGFLIPKSDQFSDQVVTNMPIQQLSEHIAD